MAGRTILEFYPFDFDYINTPEGRAIIRVFGSTKEGKKIVVLDGSIQPYFYVIVNAERSDVALAQALRLKVKTEERIVQPVKVEILKRNLVGAPVTVLKIFVQTPSDIAVLKDEVKTLPGYMDRAESDINFYKRYMIDKEIVPLSKIRVEGEEVDHKGRYNADYVINAEKMEDLGEETISAPHILAFDIETYNPIGTPRMDTDPILMISFASNKGYEKVVTWKKFHNAPDYVEFVDSEMDLINKFVEIMRKEKPDILLGYNSDNFDFPYIIARANKYKIKLDFAIDHSNIKMAKKGRDVIARITGIIHVDIYPFVVNMLAPTMRTEIFSLDSVAEELIGEKKKEGVSWENMHTLWDAGGESLRKMVEYNLHDSKLTLKLMNTLSKTMFELTKLVNQPLFDVSRMTYGQCVEWFLAKRASKFLEIIPNKPIVTGTWSRTYEGAYVHPPKPGIYDNIVVYDFRSLYPSIIISHNICPTKLFCECCKDGNKTPETDGKTYSYCKREKGFIPTVLEDLINRRARIKEMLKKIDKGDEDYSILSARSYALKTIANAMYGYFGFAKSRWYSIECAASVTAWGRHYIKQVIADAEKAKFNVIYGDTDSIMLSLEGKTVGDANMFAEKVNKKLPGIMELEFQGFYPRALFVAAKKKYALADEKGRITIKGFEFVRRDWSRIAKETQMAVLNALLIEKSEDNAVKIIKNAINKLKAGEVKIEDIVIYTQLTKKVEHYDSIGPHVAAVIKAQKLGLKFEPGQIIKYIVTKGEGSISDKSYILKEYLDKGLEYDSEYYINNQVLPAVERIFEVLGYEKDELKGKVQTKLAGFFK